MWELFQAGILSAGVLALVCGTAGIYVVLSRSVLLVMTLAQVAACGVATALFFHGRVDPGLASLASVLAAVGLLAWMRRRGCGLTDAGLGGVVAAAWALSVLLVAGSPYGLDEVEHLMFADLLLAQDGDLALMAAVGGAVLLVLAAFRRRFLLACLDPDFAASLGMRPERWRLVLDLLLGLSIAVAIRTAGTLVVFGLMVLAPAGVLASACRMRGTLAWSAAVSVSGTALGICASALLDWPAGPAVVAGAGAASAVACLLRKKI